MSLNGLEKGPLTKEKPLNSCEVSGFCLVAWTGIEPVTRGFSTLFYKLKLSFIQSI